MRRLWGAGGLVLAIGVLAGAWAAPDYPMVRPGVEMTFPRDHGAHPAFRTEWWYVTGWLKTADGGTRGFQVTFFQTRPEVDGRNPSRFTPRQVLFAHAAVSDPALGRLRHDQRVARSGFGLAQASDADTDIRLLDWSLKRTTDGRLATRATGRDFALDLSLTPTQPPLLQGDRGYSRKGPNPGEASYYYSLPHLKVSGVLTEDGRKTAVTGEAWLDREWSSTLLNPKAVGWDWVGLNLADGGAVTAFQVRDAQGGRIWAGGSYRPPGGVPRALRPDDVRFTATRRWRSPRTGALYPVAQSLSLRAEGRWRTLVLDPLFDDQELDSRAGGGPVYWEGAVRAAEGQGYLELTGYQSPLKM